MRNMLLVSLLIMLSFGSSLSGELVIKGQYSGKNVYVRNPYNNNTKAFCITNVVVNDRVLLASPQQSAIQVDLTYLKLGDLVILRIEYFDDCLPVVLNPNVLSFTNGFQFITAQADNNSINWRTKGELPNGNFFIEQLFVKKNEWREVSKVIGKGELNNNQYSVEPVHFPGENKYRIKYLDYEGKEYYSIEFAFTSTEDPVTFSPEKVTTKITLSKNIDYAITDMNGNELMKGKGKEIYVQNLKPGLYFLIVENRSERFIKH